MSDDETKEVPGAPTVAELEAKVARLTAQVDIDTKAVESATAAFKSVVKSGDVDKALVVAGERTEAQKVLVKSTSQLKTAKAAVTSANYAASAEKIASIHDRVREGKLSLTDAFGQLESLGVTKLSIERSEETGKIIINSTGPAVKRTRGAGSGTGSRGQTLTVDGTEYTSASAAIRAFFPDSGPLNRESIISKLTNAGHEVS